MEIVKYDALATVDADTYMCIANMQMAVSLLYVGEECRAKCLKILGY